LWCASGPIARRRIDLVCLEAFWLQEWEWVLEDCHKRSCWKNSIGLSVPGPHWLDVYVCLKSFWLCLTVVYWLLECNKVPSWIEPRVCCNMLRSVKDDLGLNVPGMYQIPCECGKVYMGQTGRSIETRCKEHRRHIRLDQPDKSEVAEHSINTGHCIEFSNTVIFDRTSSYIDHLVKEELHRLQQHRRFGQNIGIISWKRPLASDWTTKISTGMVASCWAILDIPW
jgi:hypothetical protein